MFINRFEAFIPHPATILIGEQNCALQKILVITIDRATDMAVGVGPLSRLDIDPGADQTDRGATIVNLNQRALGLVVEDLSMSKARERAELNQQRSCFRGVRDVAAYLARFQIYVAVRNAGWRFENGQQTITQIFGELQKSPVAGHLITRKQSAEQPDR